LTSVTLAGRTFNYGIEGNGEPIVHILGAEPATVGSRDHVTNTGIPKIAQYLKDRYQVIYYNNFRPGDVFYATKADSPTDIDRVADDCYLLMQHLNISKAHFFAHSLVSYVPLKLALNHPALVKSIAFLEFRIAEPLLLKPKTQAAMSQMVQRQMNNPKYQQQMEMMRQMMEMAKTGTTPDGQPVDPEIAAQFNRISPAFQEMFTPGADSSDPNSFLLRGQTTQMLSTAYEDVASKVKQPIFAALWSESQDWARQSSGLLQSWLTQTEIFTVPKKSHWYSGENDQGLAQGLADFYSRHSLIDSDR
jgi:pimeloyl-ACP methyl ester carboxylesterase